MKEGWICPICGRALAPWVPECPCRGVTNTSKSNCTFIHDTAANPNFADRKLVRKCTWRHVRGIRE